jgi:undecaprenyl pyrophosphate phosphatase UppP
MEALDGIHFTIYLFQGRYFLETLSPAVILALLFGKYIKAALFSPIPVATAFIVGGLIIFCTSPFLVQ